MPSMIDATPIVQLTRRGTIWHEHHPGLPRLAEEFRDRQSIRLPALIEPALVDLVWRGLERGAFEERRHEEAATELYMPPNVCTDMLHFLVNDRTLFRLVEYLSGVAPIRIFTGRVYRNLPARHAAPWHDDTIEHRQVGMSLNISDGVYEGGLFEIRDRATARVLNSIANTGLGDAILFRISPALEHRVTAVDGRQPKTAFAGWFSTAPDYFEALRANLQERLRASAPLRTTPASRS